jgi:hypothetical protein
MVQQLLVSTGKFFQSDAAMIIEQMSRTEFIEKVSFDSHKGRNKEGISKTMPIKN